VQKGLRGEYVLATFLAYNAEPHQPAMRSGGESAEDRGDNSQIDAFSACLRVLHPASFGTQTRAGLCDKSYHQLRTAPLEPIKES